MSTDLPGMTIFLDPGTTTGFAVLMRNGGFAAGQVKGLTEFGEWLNDVLMRADVDTHLGWEAYHAVGPRSRESTVPLRVMGVAAWLAHQHDVDTLPEAAPDARSLVTPDALRRIGWYREGLPHAMQAARHLLAYLIRTGTAPELVRRAFEDPAEAVQPDR